MIHSRTSDLMVINGATGFKLRDPSVQFFSATDLNDLGVNLCPKLYEHNSMMLDDPQCGLVWFSGDRRIRAVHADRADTDQFGHIQFTGFVGEAGQFLIHRDRVVARGPKCNELVLWGYQQNDTAQRRLQLVCPL